ncbi:unnamed protein product [Paramecium sonneborni]|uniref:Uncharacterized protein n=1 Tax=Paramecium sonneborni TaxID=65129 RepID=A0A8S1R4Z5_9CILI|nr:unnamed protein product [Paramecium sonneborni]
MTLTLVYLPQLIVPIINQKISQYLYVTLSQSYQQLLLEISISVILCIEILNLQIYYSKIKIPQKDQINIYRISYQMFIKIPDKIQEYEEPLQKNSKIFKLYQFLLFITIGDLFPRKTSSEKLLIYEIYNIDFKILQLYKLALEETVLLINFLKLAQKKEQEQQLSISSLFLRAVIQQDQQQMAIKMSIQIAKTMDRRNKSSQKEVFKLKSIMRNYKYQESFVLVVQISKQ